MYSSYIQDLVSLTVGLDLHLVLAFPPQPFRSCTDVTLKVKNATTEWQWLYVFAMTVRLAEQLARRDKLSPSLSSTDSSFALVSQSASPVI